MIIAACIVTGGTAFGIVVATTWGEFEYTNSYFYKPEAPLQIEKLNLNTDIGQINIIVRKRNKNVNISIIDDGKGINQDNIENIFKPYYTSKVKGTGLGLFVVREIIQAHNGRIYCSSDLDKGSKFTISLPVVSE